VSASVAAAQIEVDRSDISNTSGERVSESTKAPSDGSVRPTTPTPSSSNSTSPEPTRFYGQFSLDGVRAIRQLEEILDNVAVHLGGASNASISLTLEVNATSDGFDDRSRRVVKENAAQLGAVASEFE